MQRQMQKAPLGFLGWLIAVTLWLTWAPFKVQVGGIPEFQLKPSFNMETASHLLLLAPIGVVLAALTHGSCVRRSHMRVWGAIALFGLFLELGQGWIEGRGLSPYDALANCIGAAFAIWGTAQLIRQGTRIRPILVTVGVLVFIGVLGVTIYSFLLLNEINRDFRLTGWKSQFVVLSGDEVGGQRAYQGRVWNAQLCAGQPPIELCVAPGADRETRLRLVEIAEASQYIKVSAHVWSSSDTQRGPTRIVTFSAGPSLRNVTLGQQERALIFRIRTPWTGPNGLHAQFGLPLAIQTGIPTWVVATFSDGVVTVKSESRAGTVSGAFYPDFRLGSLRILWIKGVPHLWRGKAALVGAAVLFTSFGLAVGWQLRSRRIAAALIGPVVAALSLWTVDTWMTGMFALGPITYLFAVGTAALGVGLAVWDWKRCRCSEKDS